jgi:predicted transcriptional regulator
MTTLRITIGSRESVRDDALEFARTANADKSDDQDDFAVLQFGSYADLVDALPPRRLDLLRAIATDHPQSIREAARLVKRDVSDVHGDIKQLEVLNLIEFEEGGPGGAMRPLIRFDRLKFDVAMPLVEEETSSDHVEA